MKNCPQQRATVADQRRAQGRGGGSVRGAAHQAGRGGARLAWDGLEGLEVANRVVERRVRLLRVEAGELPEAGGAVRAAHHVEVGRVGEADHPIVPPPLCVVPGVA
eukprot:COSAG06_NODE_943_length_11375_cov_11.840635_2_plen_106_part_00